MSSQTRVSTMRRATLTDPTAVSVRSGPAARRGPVDRGAWHVVDPVDDEQRAQQLESAARRALRAGHVASGTELLSRAVAASAQPHGRVRRLAAGAHAASQRLARGADCEDAVALAWSLGPQVAAGLDVALAEASGILIQTGEVQRAHAVLTSAVAACSTPPDDDALSECLHQLSTICRLAARAELSDRLRDLLRQQDRGVRSSQFHSALSLQNPTSPAQGQQHRLDGLIDRLGVDSDPRHVVAVATAAAAYGRLGECQSVLRQLVAGAGAGGSLTCALTALTLIAEEEFQTGRWDAATATAEEGVALSRRAGWEVLGWPLNRTIAMIAAASGEDAAVQQLADSMQRDAEPRGLELLRLHAQHARGLAALGRGDYERAYLELSAWSSPQLLRDAPGAALDGSLDLAEAAVQTQQPQAVERCALVARRARASTSSPRHGLLAAAATAVWQQDQEALLLLHTAVSDPHLARWPFDQARVQLAYGQRLRRARHASDARVQLQAAQRQFEALGARPWAERARAEAAAAVPPRSSGREGRACTLTPQERVVVELAATGLTNKQIAGRLQLSPRTVSAHLYRSFPKLDVTNRAGLRDALNTRSK